MSTDILSYILRSSIDRNNVPFCMQHMVDDFKIFVTFSLNIC